MSLTVIWPGVSDTPANVDFHVVSDDGPMECDAMCDTKIAVGRIMIELWTDEGNMIVCLPCFDNASDPADGAIMTAHP